MSVMSSQQTKRLSESEACENYEDTGFEEQRE